MRHHGQHRDPVPRPPEARRSDVHRRLARHRERRQARRGAPQGRAEGRQVRGDVLEVLPAPGPRAGGRADQAREQRVPLREAERGPGPRDPRRGLPGPHAGGAVRAQRPRPEGDFVPRGEASVHPRGIRDGPDRHEAPRPRCRDGPRPREGDGEAGGRVLPRRAGRGDRRGERARPRPREAVRSPERVPDGGDERVLRGPEERAGRPHGPDEGPRGRDQLRATRVEGEADRLDHVEAPGGGGPARDAVEGRPRVYRLALSGAGKLLPREPDCRTRIPPMASDRKRSFLEGFEAGLRAAWNEAIKLASRGYSSTELGVMAKTKLATIHRDIEAMATRLDEEGGIEETGEAGAIGARGAYLVNEEKADAVYGHFRALVKSGARGLAISRSHPADIAKKFQFGTVEAIWLSRTPDKSKSGDVAIADPTNLVALAAAVVEFLAAR